MRTAVLIPARLAATRLPNKPLADLAGLPLVVRTAQRALKSRADWIAVATEDEEIHQLCVKYNIDSVLTGKGHPSGSDRIAEVVAQQDISHVINLQADEPFVDPDDLNAIFAALNEDRAPVVTLRAPIDDAADIRSPHCVKVVCRDDGLAMYFSRAPIPYHRADTKGTAKYFRHIGVYGYQRDALLSLTASPPHLLEIQEGLEQLRALAHGIPIYVITTHHTYIGIDTPEDLAKARAALESSL